MRDATCLSCRRSIDGADPAPVDTESEESEPVESRPVLWTAVMVGALFAAGAVYNFAANGIVSVNGAVDATLAFACYQLFIFMKREQRRTDDFHRWVIANASVLRSGTGSYGTVQLDRDSEVTQFQGAISLLIVTLTVRSRPYVVGQDPLLLPGMMYTVISLLLGWWGLPWGPVRTIHAIVVNATGGKRQRIGELVLKATENSRNIVRLTRAAADEVRRVIIDRQFAPDTAVRVVPIEPTIGDYEIQYDLPVNDGRDWQMQSEALTVLVNKSDVDDSDLSEIVVDFKDGRFTFDRAWHKDVSRN